MTELSAWQTIRCPGAACTAHRCAEARAGRPAPRGGGSRRRRDRSRSAHPPLAVGTASSGAWRQGRGQGFACRLIKEDAARILPHCPRSSMSRSARTLGRRAEDSPPSRRTWRTRQPLPCYVLDVGGPEALGQSTCRGGGLVSQGREKPNRRSQAPFDRNKVESARGSRARFNRTIAAATGSPDLRACGSTASG